MRRDFGFDKRLNDSYENETGDFKSQILQYENDFETEVQRNLSTIRIQFSQRILSYFLHLRIPNKSRRKICV